MINTEIWGSSETWAYYDQQRYHDIRLVGKVINNDTYRTLYRLVDNDVLNENEPVDKSICITGMGAECPYSNVKYITVDDGTLKTDTQQRSVTNWVYYNCDGFGVYTGRYRTTCLFKNNAYGNYRNFSNILSEYWNGNSEITFFTDFDYKKLILHIRVVASATEISTPAVFSLDDYVATEYVNYPYVRYVCARLYYEQSTNPTVRTYIHSGTIEGYHYATTAILDDYETTLTTPNLNRTYCNHISEARGNNIPVLGLSCYTTAATLPPESDGRIYITYGVDDDWTINKDENDNIILCYHVTDINVFKEKALRAAAAFGCYFTGDTTTAETGALTNDKMYIGVVDSNGITHGDYLKGTNTANATQNTWNTARDSNYDYTKDVDKTKYQNGTQFNLNVETSAFNKFYALTKSDVTQLANELYSIANDVPSGVSVTEYNMKTFLTNNPIDCIISLKKFPVKNIPLIGTPNNIYLGAKQTDILGCEVLAKTFVYYFNFSAANDTALYPVNGNTFLDYEPYTKCTIVVPFCGSTEIPCSYMYEYGGCTVALMIDFVTGACTAFIMVNGNTIETLHGNCAINLPVSGIQSATLDANVNSTVQNYNSTAISSAISVIGGGLSFIIGAASLNPMLMLGGAAAIATGAIKGELAEQKTTYELQHMQTPFKSVSAASGAIAQSGDLRCKLLISRPKISPDYDATVYANTIGFACLDNTTVDKLSGLTIGDINLKGIQATDIEKQLIKKAFESGVIL